MRKLFSMMSIFVFIIAAACGSNEVHKVDGKGPADIPVKWANAEVQKDQATRAKLLVENDGIMSPDKGPENDKTIEKYKLTEWKVNDDDYFYEITYLHPIKNELKTERMEVIKTDSGWKRKEYGDIYNFDKLVEDLKPEVLRELHDK